MPAPHGHTPRDRKFLLRMTAPEDEFARRLAVRHGTSLNDVLTGLIRAEMAREETPPPAPAPEPPAPKLPPKRRARRPTTSTAERAASLLPPPVEPVPGQMPLTSDE